MAYFPALSENDVLDFNIKLILLQILMQKPNQQILRKITMHSDLQMEVLYG